MKERILVTGGTGYIGSHTVVELQNAGFEVVIIDNLSNTASVDFGIVDNIEKVSGIRPAFEKLDCLDFAGLDAVFTKYKGVRAISPASSPTPWAVLRATVTICTRPTSGSNRSKSPVR